MFPQFLLAILCSTVLSAPAVCLAGNGDCGQPTSTGSGTTGSTPPATTTSDALSILQEAVGQFTTCDRLFCELYRLDLDLEHCERRPCICDVNFDQKITARDALIVLRYAVGAPGDLDCACEGPGVGCSSVSFTTTAGSELDLGWTGIVHDNGETQAAKMTMRIASRCSDSGELCDRNADCGNFVCLPTCDCSLDNDCELVGPTQGKRCVTTLKSCETNTDCGGTIACVSTFGPPRAVSAGGTPVCIQNVFSTSLSGSVDFTSGDFDLRFDLRARWFLGITVDKPCPRCGHPDDDPQIGDQFTCDGGQFVGAPCTVDGVTEAFGGTSFDCPSKLDANVTGAGLAIPIALTTGTTSRTARLPCSDTSFRSNPTLPLDKCLGGSNPGADCSTNTECPQGGVCNVPQCLDTGERCTSNADCRRCTGDTRTECSAHGDCGTAGGTCSEAPDQPVTCGYWCNCGFCNGNASKPCFETSECAVGETCQVGPGTGSQQNIPQRKPNDCAQDDYVCGHDETERCATTPVGQCELQPYRSCTSGSITCETNNAGTCVVTTRPCFEPRITRSGEPSPLGAYCTIQDKPCHSNADCTGMPGDNCAYDLSRPETVALYCNGGTSGPGKNNVSGITGPAALRLRALVTVCRCGDESVGCDEQCDDGNRDPGDGCDEHCQDE